MSPKRRLRPARKSRRSDPYFAFINVPYDDKFEPLYLALIAGLSGFGLIPQATLQIPGSQRRLDRIFELICTCRYSFHDLCRVELDPKRPKTPRFNMPFELGLAFAWARFGDPDHAVYVFESKKRRVAKSLSDLDGTEIYIHENKPVSLLRQLTNALERSKHRPTMKELRAIYRDLKKDALKIKQTLATRSLYDTRPFMDVVIAGGIRAKQHIASLQSP